MKKYIEENILSIWISEISLVNSFSVIRIMVLNLLMSLHTGQKQAAIIQHGQVSGL